MLPCMIYYLNLNCLVDTGSTISLLQPEKYYAIIEEKRPPLELYLPKIRMGDGASITAIGCAIFPLTINGRLTPQKMVVANIEVAGVLGYDVLYDNAADINIREGSVSINGTAIKCENARIKQAPRRLPPVKHAAATEEIKKMLERGLITPSKSTWSSPITLVKKKDSTLRFCIDYRKLNEVTRKDCFPLPRTDDSLDALGGNKYFSVIDLSSGY